MKTVINAVGETDKCKIDVARAAEPEFPTTCPVRHKVVLTPDALKKLLHDGCVTIRSYPNLSEGGAVNDYQIELKDSIANMFPV